MQSHAEFGSTGNKSKGFGGSGGYVGPLFGDSTDLSRNWEWDERLIRFDIDLFIQAVSNDRDRLNSSHA